MRWTVVAFAALALTACSSSTNNNLTQYSVSVSVNGSGQGVVTSSPGGINCGATCSARVNSGTAVTFTATPAQGSVFAGWSGACTGTNSTCSVTVKAASSVTATFNVAPPSTANLKVVLTGTGTGSLTSSPPGVNCTKSGAGDQTCTATVTIGTPVTLTASSSDSAVTFGGCDQVSNNDCLVNPSGDRTVTVTYAIPTHKLTISRPTGNVTVVAASAGIDCEMDPAQAQVCSAGVTAGQTVVLTATSEYGNPTFTSGCDSVSGNTCTVTVNSDVTVQVDAPYEPHYAVQFQGAGAGSVSSNLTALNCASSSGGCQTSGVNPASFPIAITAAAGTNSFFAGWSQNCPAVSGTDKETCTIASAVGGEDVTLVATFHQQVTGAQASQIGREGALISWDAPWTDSMATAIYVRYALTGSSSAWTPAATLPASDSSFLLTGLQPNTGYDVQVELDFSDGTFSYQNLQFTTAAGLTGNTADWSAGQLVPTATGGKLGVTWDAGNLYVGMTSSSGQSLVPPGGGFALYINTDAPGDALGNDWMSDPTQKQMVWLPFKADYMVAMQVDATTGAVTAQVVNLDTGAAASSPTVFGIHGAFDELQLAAADIGNPTRIQIAAAVMDSQSTSLDLAPVNPNATDVYGYHTSFTASLDTYNAIWNPSDAANTASYLALSPVSNLVYLSVSQPAGVTGNLKVRGSMAPFTWDTSLVHYALKDDGMHGDGAAADGVYGGAFNLHGQSGELYFKFVDDNGAEPTFVNDGTERVYTLAGGQEQLPELTWNQVYSATSTGGFDIVFSPSGLLSNGLAANEIRGAPSPLTWGSDTGGVIGTGGTATVHFSAVDSVSTPIEFKAVYDDGAGNATWQGDCWNGVDGNLRSNDDVINYRTIYWDVSSCPANGPTF